jgi:hypothetical protein
MIAIWGDGSSAQNSAELSLLHSMPSSCDRALMRTRATEGLILQRAKEMCHKDGKAWSLDDLENHVPGVTMVTLIASDDDRIEYLNRSREFLEKT